MYTATLDITDYGTERLLIVKRDQTVILQCDPFHAKGVPASKATRRKILGQRVSQAVRQDLQALGLPNHEVRYRAAYPASFA